MATSKTNLQVTQFDPFQDGGRIKHCSRFLKEFKFVDL